MGKRELIRFIEWLHSDDKARREVAAMASDHKRIVAYAIEHGYPVVIEDLTNVELSEEELEQIAGGGIPDDQIIVWM